MTAGIRERSQVLIVPVLVALAWEIATRSGLLDQRFFIPLTDIFLDLGKRILDGQLIVDLLITIRRLLFAFGIAALCGVAIGVAAGLSDIVRALYQPISDTLFPLPKVAVLPLFIIIVGRGELAYIFTAMATGFFQIVISSRGAVDKLDPQIREAGENFGARGRLFYTRLLFPAIAPDLYKGLRLGMSTCLITLVVVEYIAASSGLGGSINDSAQQFIVGGIYSGILVTGILGLAINGLFRICRPLVMPWTKGDRRGNEFSLE